MAQWLTILKAAAEIAAAVGTLGGLAVTIYKWFEDLMGRSQDQKARKAWEDFRKDPQGNKEALADAAMHLRPDGDPVLEGYVLGLAKERLRANSARIYELLTSRRYTYQQVDDICTRLDPARPGLGQDPTQQEMARWATTLAGTRQELLDRLISIMLEVNPDVIPEVVTLV